MEVVMGMENMEMGMEMEEIEMGERDGEVEMVVIKMKKNKPRYPLEKSDDGETESTRKEVIRRVAENTHFLEQSSLSSSTIPKEYLKMQE